MATTTTGRARGPRVRGSDRGGRADRGAGTGADQQYDLLTAALLGAVIGAGTTLLLRRPPRRRFALADLPGVPRGVKLAANAARAGGRGARWLRGRGEDLVERTGDLHVDRALRGYMASARKRIDAAVSSEVNDLRKALRRQRRRLGI
jgi:hypothetical protein